MRYLPGKIWGILKIHNLFKKGVIAIVCLSVRFTSTYIIKRCYSPSNLCVRFTQIATLNGIMIPHITI